MDIITPEDCQAIIDNISTWEPIDLVKARGGHLNFKQAPVVYWGNTYPNIMHELVLKYDTGDFCTLHTDSPWYQMHPTYRAYSVWITPLNSDYTGGELYFDGELIPQQVGVPVKYLRTVPHEVKPVTSGIRYSMVSWYFAKDSAVRVNN